VISTFHSTLFSKNSSQEIGRYHLVLIEEKSQKSKTGKDWFGRTDTNKVYIFIFERERNFLILLIYFM